MIAWTIVACFAFVVLVATIGAIVYVGAEVEAYKMEVEDDEQ